jgi:AsmA protein
MKKALIIAGGVVVLLLVVIIALPLFIDANQFKPTIETDLAAALGRKVSIGNIKLAIFSGGVTVDDVSIADDPAFSQSPFLTAKQLAVGVSLMPLIFSKRIDIQSLTIDSPQVALVRTASGTWNFSSMGAAGTQPKPQASDSSATNLSVAKFKISNGSIAVGTTTPGGKRRTYQNVNLDASNLSYTSEFPFTLTASTPGSGTVKLDGKAGPIDQKDVSLTPLSATIDVSHLDVASTGFVDPASGIAGLIDFNGMLASDGHSMNSKGTLKADKFKVVPNGSPSGVPVNVDYDTDYDLKAQTGVLKSGDVHIGKALAHLTGNFNAAGAVATVQLKLVGQGMSVPDLEGVLPAVGVTLPSGASLKTGTMETTLAISGPVDKLVITGPVNLANAQIAGFNLRSKLGALGPLSGLGGSNGSDTEIQTLSANLRVDPSGENADNLNLVVPTIGTITGTANVSSAGQLNCKMLANLAGSIGAVTSALTSFTGGGSSSKGGGIPFKITGTTSNPIFLPDLSGAAGNMVKGLGNGTNGAAGSAASAAQGVIGGLFGKKKSQ